MSRYYTLSDGSRLTFPDDATPAEMDSLVAAHEGTTSKAVPQMTRPPSLSTRARIDAQRFGKQVVSGLPFIGGVAGGVIGLGAGGPVGAPIGAGIGGALGEGYRQALTQKNLDPLQMGVRGSEQALGEAVAGGLGALRPAAKFPEFPRTISVKSKILNQYGNNFRRKVEFYGARKPPAPAPAPELTVKDVAHIAHLMAPHGIATKLATHPKFVAWLARQVGGPIGRQSPRVLYEMYRQSQEPDSAGQ